MVVSPITPQIILEKHDLIILMGAPGAGKDTHARHLAEETNAIVRSGSQILINLGNYQEEMANGDLVAEDAFITVLKYMLNSAMGQPLILNGSTRKPREAQWLLDHLASYGRRLVGVIFIDVSESVSFARVTARAARGDTSKRPDDEVSKFATRWRAFTVDTLQSVALYEERGYLLRVDGNKSVEEVRAEINFALWSCLERIKMAEPFKKPPFV